MAQMLKSFSLATGPSTRTDLIDYARQCSLWTLGRAIGLDEATAITDKIVTLQTGRQGLARRHGLVPWYTETDPTKGTLVLCPIPKEMVSTMQNARSFHEAHSNHFPSENTFGEYRDYFEALTTLVNHLEKVQSNASHAPTGRVRSISRNGVTSEQLSLYALTTEIPKAKDKLEGVMFVVSEPSLRP